MVHDLSTQKGRNAYVKAMSKPDPYKLKEYFHVVQTKNKLEVVPSPFHECTKVKDSVASFTKREFAVTHLNDKTLK